MYVFMHKTILIFAFAKFSISLYDNGVIQYVQSLHTFVRVHLLVLSLATPFCIMICKICSKCKKKEEHNERPIATVCCKKYAHVAEMLGIMKNYV